LKGVAQSDGLGISNLSPSHLGSFWRDDGGDSWNSNNSGLPNRSASSSDENPGTAVPASTSALPQAPHYVLLEMAEVHVNTVLRLVARLRKQAARFFIALLLEPAISLKPMPLKVPSYWMTMAFPD